jgi:hypothetical protein
MALYSAVGGPRVEVAVGAWIRGVGAARVDGQIRALIDW